MSKRRNDPGLFKIIVVVVCLGVAAAGVLRVAQWFQERVDRSVEAAAVDTLEQARLLIADENGEQARELIQPILARVENPAILPEAILLQADIELQIGNTAAALENLRSVSEDFPTYPEQHKASLRYAGLLQEEGRDAAALSVYERVRKSAPPTERAEATLQIALDQFEKGEQVEASKLFDDVVRDAAWGSDAWFEAAYRQGQMNVESIFSSGPTDDSKVYRVSSGDSLTSIGMKLNTTQGLLMRANNMDNPNRLRPNQSMKYTPKDFEIVIERSTCLLYLLDGDGLFAVYRVGLGKRGNDTTLGRYRIGNKEKDPTWHKPGAKAIPPGDPKNELGTRWMPLIPEGEDLPTDLGIHGTIKPDSIGKYESMGCPRLQNEKVEELYDLVVRSTPVTIVDTYDSEGPNEQLSKAIQ